MLRVIRKQTGAQMKVLRGCAPLWGLVGTAAADICHPHTKKSVMSHVKAFSPGIAAHEASSAADIDGPYEQGLRCAPLCKRVDVEFEACLLRTGGRERQSRVQLRRQLACVSNHVAKRPPHGNSSTQAQCWHA